MNNELKRRHLPHLYLPFGTYFITFRINGTLPLDIINSYKYDRDKSINNFINYDLYLDKLTNNKITLLQPDIAAICKDSFTFYNGKKYVLISYCIMANHIHMLITLRNSNTNISQILKVVKGFSSYKINKLLGLSGTFWQNESYDRFIRDDAELFFTIKYILLNPVCAGLVDNWKNWDNTYCHPDYEIDIESDIVSKIISNNF